VSLDVLPDRLDWKAFTKTSRPFAKGDYLVALRGGKVEVRHWSNFQLIGETWSANGVIAYACIPQGTRS